MILNFRDFINESIYTDDNLEPVFEEILDIIYEIHDSIDSEELTEVIEFVNYELRDTVFEDYLTDNYFELNERVIVTGGRSKSSRYTPDKKVFTDGGEIEARNKEMRQRNAELHDTENAKVKQKIKDLKERIAQAKEPKQAKDLRRKLSAELLNKKRVNTGAYSKRFYALRNMDGFSIKDKKEERSERNKSRGIARRGYKKYDDHDVDANDNYIARLRKLISKATGDRKTKLKDKLSKHNNKSHGSFIGKIKTALNR